MGLQRTRLWKPISRQGGISPFTQPSRNGAFTPLAIAAAMLYPTAATWAQQSSGGDSLEEVIVTATRREVNLQVVPQSVTALSTEFIQKEALTNLYDLAGALPSLNIVSVWPGQNSIIIRGISTGSAQYRIDSQVSIYLDEQPMTSITQQADVRLIDIQRVELLPGPQGTLFGSSAQAGTLHYVTNKPDTSAFSSEVAAEIGTTKGGEESYDVSGWVNVPLSDTFALRAVGFYSDEGGYVDNVLGTTLAGDATNADIAGEDQNSYRQSGGRVSGLWSINPDWNLLLTGIYQRSKTDGHWDTDPFLGDHKITRFFDDWRDDEWYTMAGTLKGNLGFAELSLTASYFDRRIDYEFDDTNYAQWRTSRFGYYALYDTGTLHAVTFNYQDQKRWAYEARLTSLGDSKLQWMAGAFYEDVYDWWEFGDRLTGGDFSETRAWEEANAQACDLDDPALAKCPLDPTQIYYYNNYSNKVKQLAFFGELTYALTDKWSVTGGARWFKFDRELFDKYNVPFGVPAQSDPDANGLLSTGKDSDTTFKFATNYRFTPEVMVYGLYSEGFRLGGRNSQRAAETGEVPAEYGPDHLKNYEVGIKSDWLDNRLRLNISVFLMEWDDIQIHFSETDGEGGAFWVEGNINGGKAEQKGVELNGEWRATPRLSLEWNAFLASPEFTESTLIPNTQDVYIAKGTTLPVSPKEKYWAAVEYTFPDFLPLAGDFWTRFSYTWQGKTWDSLDAIEDNDYEFLLPEWKSGTFQLGFTGESGWEAALIVRNLFDDRGITWQSSSDRGAEFDDPRWRYVRGLQRPRSVSLSFTKKW
jgi:iron complex outermembrane recepter protein